MPWMLYRNPKDTNWVKRPPSFVLLRNQSKGSDTIRFNRMFPGGNGTPSLVTISNNTCLAAWRCHSDFRSNIPSMCSDLHTTSPTSLCYVAFEFKFRNCRGFLCCELVLWSSTKLLWNGFLCAFYKVKPLRHLMDVREVTWNDLKIF